MKRLPFLIIILATFAVSVMSNGCARKTKAWSIMNEAESIMDSLPDSARTMLERIDRTGLGGVEERARYALLISIALDKTYTDTTTFDLLQPAIDYYLKHGTPDEKLRTLYYQGRIYQNRNDNDSAMQCFMRAKDYSDRVTDPYAVANLLVAQATILYTTYRLDDCARNNIEAAQLYGSIGRIDYEVSCLCNAMSAYSATNNEELADSLMSVINERIAEHPETETIVEPYLLTYMTNVGNQDEIRTALAYFTSLESMSDYDKLVIANAYLKIDEPLTAKEVINSISCLSPVRNSLKYKALMPFILEEAGDPIGALNAYRTFSATIDSIHMDIFSHDLLFAESRHEMEKTNLMEIRKRDRIVWLTLCLIFLLVICSGLIYYRYRLGKAKNLLAEQETLRLKLHQENLMKENEKLELAKQNAILEKQRAESEKQRVESDRLREALEAENLRLRIKQLEDESATLKDILEKRDDLAKPVEEAIKVRIEMLNSLFATRITENESFAKSYGEWRDRLLQDKDQFMDTTRLAFKVSHPKFITYLEQHGLTEAEINYVCLYAIGLRGKEVGEYIQLKRHYHISSDIRKKLGLDEHATNISIHIRKLMKSL